MSYAQPATLSAALDLLAGGAAVVVAGGTDFYPALGQRPAPSSLLDLTRIAELRGVSREGAGWRIGGCTTWSDLIAAALPPGFDGLKAAAREIGSVQIQNAGTIAGNLCNASPAADGVPPLLALAASVELTGNSGRRVVALEDFLLGVRRTALQAGEVLTAVLVPDLPDAARGSFQKLGARRYLVISVAMVSALVWADAGRIAGCRVAVGACSPVARRLGGLEAAVVGRKSGDLDPGLWSAHLGGLAPIDDVRATAGYRLDAVAELVRRAVLGALDG